MFKRLLDWLIILLPLALPLYVVRFSVGPLPTTVLEIYILVLIVTWLLSKVDSGQGAVIGNKSPSSSSSHSSKIQVLSSRVRSSIGVWFWPLVAWLVATFIAVFVAQDSVAAFGHWRAFMLEPVLIFIILLDFLAGRPHGDARTVRLLQCVAIATILLGAYAIFQYVTGWGIPSPWDAEVGRRATGIFGYPNGLSLFIVPFGIVSFLAFLERIPLIPPLTRGKLLKQPLLSKRGLGRLVFLLATISAGIGAVLAKSMGGVLAFATGVVLTLILFKKTRVVGLALGAIGIIGSAVVAWQIYGTELHPATIEDSLASTKKWSSSVRVIIWQESFEIIKDHPIFGTGLRSYKTAILPYHTATWMETFPHPHNIFLMLWIETGILGLLAFIWLIGTWVFIVLRPTSQSSHVNGANDAERATQDARRYIWIVPLVVILVHGMVDMPYFKNDLAVQFFLLAAIATTISRHSEHVSRSNP